MSNVTLWLFVIVSGIALGAGLYEMRINVPRWFARRGGVVVLDAAAMNADDPARRFWAFVSTGPLTLLTIASLVLSWDPETPRDWWWHIASLVTLVERVFTAGYFIPTAIRLMQPGKLAADRASVMAARWSQLNALRAALALAAWLCALKAFSLVG